MDLEVADGDAGGVGGERNFIAAGAAVLLDREGVASGLDGLERGVQGEGVLLVLVGIGFEGDVDVLGFVAGEGDLLDAADGVAGEGELVVLAGEELRVADDLPVFAATCWTVRVGPSKASKPQ